MRNAVILPAPKHRFRPAREVETAGGIASGPTVASLPIIASDRGRLESQIARPGARWRSESGTQDRQKPETRLKSAGPRLWQPSAWRRRDPRSEAYRSERAGALQ